MYYSYVMGMYDIAKMKTFVNVCLGTDKGSFLLIASILGGNQWAQALFRR